MLALAPNFNYLPFPCNNKYTFSVNKPIIELTVDTGARKVK